VATTGGTYHSSIESHNSLFVVERYYGPLRRIYRKIRSEHPTIPQSLARSLSFKAVNDFTGPAGLVSSLLVFGIVSRLPLCNQCLPNQCERMTALASARSEMETIVAGLRIDRAKSSKIPPGVHRNFAAGEMVSVYRERVDEGTGPYPNNPFGREGNLRPRLERRETIFDHGRQGVSHVQPMGNEVLEHINSINHPQK
jgi:hypothetical protein